jgi:hypothetical protein
VVSAVVEVVSVSDAVVSDAVVSVVVVVLSVVVVVMCAVHVLAGLTLACSLLRGGKSPAARSGR